MWDLLPSYKAAKQSSRPKRNTTARVGNIPPEAKALPEYSVWNSHNINPFTPMSSQIQTPLQPDQKYNFTQYEEHGFSLLTQMENDYTT